jgi:hypothetical protein
MRQAHWRRIGIGLLILALLFFAGRDLGRLGGAAPWQRMFEFEDFYCAGDALNHGRDPYRYEPLRTCEHAHAGRPIMNASPALAVPAPQPPYDLAAYRPLALLPYSIAVRIDAAATVLALVVCGVSLALAGVALDVALVALLLPIGFVELGMGQIAVYALTALALCGAALSKKQDAWAGAFGGLVAIEPHVGLPVCAALAIFVPRARVTLALTLLGLGIAGALAGGGTFGEYLLRVLPAHALAEAANPQQYSATYAAWFFGLPRPAAVLAGDAAYALAVAAGLVLAALQRKTTAAGRALLAYLPAACAVFGGVFVHGEELPFAIPAALVLACALSGWRRAVAAAAACVLTVPWLFVWPVKALFAITLLVCVWILVRLEIRFWPALAVAGGIAICIYAFELVPPDLHTAAPPAAHFAANALAQVEWSAVMRQLQTRDPLWFAIKIPVWAALAALVAVAAGARRAYSATGP